MNAETFTVVLADKPRDLLIHLVDHGATTAPELAAIFDDTAIFAGGLNTLLAVGLAAGPVNERDRTYRATEDGYQLVARARVQQATDSTVLP